MTLKIFPDVEQGSEEWHDQRRGIVTASVVGQLITLSPADPLDVVGCATCGVAAGDPCISLTRKEPTPIKTIHPYRAAVAAERPLNITPADNDTSRAITAMLAAERISGYTEDVYVSNDMMRGTLDEPFARMVYSDHYDVTVDECGFMVREEAGWTLGYSPDGLVCDDGLIEIKSPRAKNHLQTILADEVPAHNMAQCQAALFVSGRKWLDFVSYRGGMRLYVKRVLPDPKWHRAIEETVRAFEMNVSAMTETYNQRTHGLPMTQRIDHFAEMSI